MKGSPYSALSFEKVPIQLFVLKELPSTELFACYKGGRLLPRIPLWRAFPFLDKLCASRNDFERCFKSDRFQTHSNLLGAEIRWELAAPNEALAFAARLLMNRPAPKLSEPDFERCFKSDEFLFQNITDLHFSALAGRWHFWFPKMLAEHSWGRIR